MNKIYFQSHGCSTNYSEGEIMAGLVSKAGFEVVDTIKDADILVLNTCTVKGETNSVRELKKFEKENKKIIIAGCITKDLVKEIRNISDEASIINTHNLDLIVDVVEEVINGNVIEAVSYEKEKKKILMPRIRRNPVIGIVPICSGCNEKCAYCSVKMVKGRMESYSKEDIIQEVKNALKDKCQEIWITSQDNAAYGTEKIWRSSLPELIKEITELEGNFKIRLGMMNPWNLKPILDEIIEVYKNEKVFKFIHLPIQSGSDDVLEKMERRYTVDEFKTIINRFKTEIPNLTFSTDIIVGYPGETVEDFNKTVEIIKELSPDVLNISRFQKRKGTKAAYMEDQVATNISKERSKIITDIFGNISRLNNERWIDWEGEIIIDEKGKDDSWVGRNFAYKQIIVKGDYKLGDKVKVKIENTTVFDLRAERA